MAIKRKKINIRRGGSNIYTNIYDIEKKISNLFELRK